jgi:tetratricopeptide (TPR) repeat protein
LLLFWSCRQKKEEEKAASQQTATPVTEVDRLTNEITVNPKNANAYYQRAKIYTGQKKFKPALADINQAIALDSTKAGYFLTQADILFTNLLIPQAKQAFEKSLELDPKNTEVYLKLAELHLYLKKYKDCLQYANEALKIDKHMAKAYFIKGFAFKEGGDTAKAISSFQTCVEQEPENYDGYMQLGLLYSARKSKLAAQYFSNALRLNPKSIEALYGRGLFYQETKEFNKAFEDYTSILRIDPNYKDAHYNLGYIHLVHLKVYDQAIRHFNDAIRSDPYFVQAYYNRGLCYENLGDIAAAAKDYKQALNIFPTYKLAKEGLKRVRE